MLIPLIVGAWLLLLWLAGGLCAAARLGDRAETEEPFVVTRQAQAEPEPWAAQASFTR
jgi:hypothetical protein